MNHHSVYPSWRERAEDSRLSSLAEFASYAKQQAMSSATERVCLNEFQLLKPDQAETELALSLNGRALSLTHWSFYQLCELLDLPTAHLRQVPINIVLDTLEWALSVRETKTVSMLRCQAGSQSGDTLGVARAFVPVSYDRQRLWDNTLALFLSALADANGWRAQKINVSDRNTFVLMVNDNAFVEDPDSGGVWLRGFLVWNSEVRQMPHGIQSVLCHSHTGNVLIGIGNDPLKGVGLAPCGQYSVGDLVKIAQASVNLSAEQEKEVLDHAAKTQVADDAMTARDLLVRHGRYSKEMATEIVAEAGTNAKEQTNLLNIALAASRISNHCLYADERTERQSQASAFLKMF